MPTNRRNSSRSDRAFRGGGAEEDPKSTRRLHLELGAIAAKAASPRRRETEDLTLLLHSWQAGDRDAGAELIRLVYSDLRRLASRELSFERAYSVQATELVHEAYMRLVGARRHPSWSDRGHFFAVFSRVVRQVLVDLARARGSLKRGRAGSEADPQEEPSAASEDWTLDLLALNRALDQLSTADPLAVQVIELRYFGGLTVNETAHALDLGRTTVDRKWRAARAWLCGALAGTQGETRRGIP